MTLLIWIAFTALVLFLLRNRVELVEDWRGVLKRAESMWCAYGAIALYLIETAHEDVIAAVPLLAPLIGDGRAGELSALLVATIPAARLWGKAKARSREQRDEE